MNVTDSHSEPKGVADWGLELAIGIGLLGRRAILDNASSVSTALPQA